MKLGYFQQNGGDAVRRQKSRGVAAALLGRGTDNMLRAPVPWVGWAGLGWAVGELWTHGAGYADAIAVESRVE